MTIKKDNKDVNVFNLALKPGTTDEYYVTLDTVSLGGQPVDDSATVKEIAKNLLTFIKDYNKTNTSGIPFAQRIDKLGVTDGQKVEPEGAVVNVDKVTATDPTKEAPKYNITFTGLELGYYLVDTSAGTMLGLTTTDPNAVITAKNKLPSIQKEVKKHGNGEWGENNSKAIGETVTFRTTVTVEARREELCRIR